MNFEKSTNNTKHALVIIEILRNILLYYNEYTINEVDKIKLYQTGNFSISDDISLSTNYSLLLMKTYSDNIYNGFVVKLMKNSEVDVIMPYTFFSTLCTIYFRYNVLHCGNRIGNKNLLEVDLTSSNYLILGENHSIMLPCTEEEYFMYSLKEDTAQAEEYLSEILKTKEVLTKAKESGLDYIEKLKYIKIITFTDAIENIKEINECLKCLKCLVQV